MKASPILLAGTNIGILFHPRCAVGEELDFVVLGCYRKYFGGA